MENITGIYKITNKVNGKIYIGQSVDCHRRKMEHLRSGQPEKYGKKNERDSNTPIHLAMQKYGVENFSFEIIEECAKELLNEKERYWINYYDSQNKEKGYNLSIGGQDNVGAKGEYHSQAKLTQQEVDEIIDLLQHTELTLDEIADKYNKVGKSMICLINAGKNWYNKELSYPLRKVFTSQRGEKSPKAKFTNDEVMKMRQMYADGMQPKSICQLYPNISQSTIKAILYGRSYKYLPYYNRTSQKWIEPCIDHSQSLK